MTTVQGFFRKILHLSAQIIFRHAGLVAGLGIAITALSGWYTCTHFKVINNIGAILDENSPVNRSYLKYKKEFNVDEEYVIVITSDDVELNRRLADEMAGRLRDIGPGIDKVFYKIDFSKMEKRFLLFENTDELAGIEKDVSSYVEALKTTKINFDLNSMLDQANHAFSDDKYLRKKDNWKDFKPFVDHFVSMLNQLADQIEDKHQKAAIKAAQSIVPSEPTNDLATQDLDKLIAEREYISYEHGKTLLIMATPGRREKDSASPYTGTLLKIRELIKEMHAQHPDVSIGLTGEPVLNDDEMQTATHDATFASIITFVLILALFWVSYKEHARPGLAIVVLLMAVVWCFAATMLLVGHLNIITQAFVPMVLGLGIDFGIQIMGRYEEELGRGRTVAEALMETLEHTGVAIVTGGSTTAAAFYTMCFNDFKGLSELGVICGTSMILCMIANIILLPAFYVLRDRNRKPADLQSANLASESYFANNLNDRIVSRPLTVIGAGVTLTLLLLIGLNRVRFDYNLLNLQNPKLESVRVEKDLLHKVGNASIYASITADNIDQVRELTKRLEALPTVKDVESIASVVPDNQQAKLVIINRIVGSLQGVKLDTDVTSQVDVAKARHDITSLLKATNEAEKQAQMYVGVSKMARDAMDTFKKLIPPLQRAQSAMEGLSQEELGKRLNRYQVEVFGNMQRGLAWLQGADTTQEITINDVPPELQKRFIGNSGKLLLQVYAKGDIWERGPLVEFVDQLRQIDPDVTGTPVQNYAYIDLLRSSYQEAAIWAFLAIAVLILLHFRSLRDSLLAMTPLCLGVIWTLGTMGLFNIKFNPANIMTLPMLLGVGVAYGVYTTDRFREAGRMEIFSTSTGKAIVLSALTTIFGFASMLISDYRGLFSMGLVMTLGVTYCLLTSMILLPQVLKLLEKKPQDPASKSN